MSFSVDFSRMRTGEWVAAAGGIALFAFLFVDWYSSEESFGGGGVGGWDVLIDLPGFIVILSGLVAIKFAALRALGMRLNWALRPGAFTLAIGWLASAIVLWRMVAGSPELKIGIFLGLAATLTITVGALLALREDGFSPVVPVAGGRARRSSSRATASRKTTTTRKSGGRKTATKRSSGSRSTTTRKRK